MLLSTLWTAASLPLMLPVVSGFALQVAMHQLIVPRHRRTTLGRRALAVAGPTADSVELAARRSP